MFVFSSTEKAKNERSFSGIPFLQSVRSQGKRSMLFVYWIEVLLNVEQISPAGSDFEVVFQLHLYFHFNLSTLSLF